MPKPTLPPTPDVDPVIASMIEVLHRRVLAKRAELSQLERALAALSTPPGPEALPHRAPKATPATRKVTRPKKARQIHAWRKPGGKTLRDYLIDALRAEPGQTAAELTPKVIAAGWQTTSATPKTVVGVELSGKRGQAWFKRDKAGEWTLRKPEKAKAAEKAEAVA